LSGFVDLPDRDRYLQAAKRMLDELASPAYLAAGTPSPAVLLHGVGNLPEGKAVDAGLIYGDYYFIEALARLRAASPSGTDGGPVGGGPGGCGRCRCSVFTRVLRGLRQRERCCDRRTRPPGVRSGAPAATAQTSDSSGETRSQLTCRGPISIAPW